MHFIVRLRHKASGAALGPSCAVYFEQPAGVFAGCGAVCQAKILASLKIKNGISGRRHDPLSNTLIIRYRLF